jgi:hypothetical protein
MPTMADFLALAIFLAVFAGVIFFAVRSKFPSADSFPAGKEGRPLFSARQWFDFSVMPALTFALFMIMLHVHYDYVSTLWRKEMGIKMVVVAMTQFLVGEALLALVCFFRNRTMASQGGLRAILLVAFFLTIVVFMLPLMLVILVGPAAIWGLSHE